MKTQINKLLVANRGEIALRIMRSAHELGIPTVAVYSTADAGSPHVEYAHEAVCIGQAPPRESYLDTAAVLEAARLTGADAVHPGYGFLSENAAFARACREAGLCFVGPSEEAIRAMGDKARAKILMGELGLPCIPGYGGPGQDPAVLKAQAQALGYPLMIKATAGGGGRGMRIVAAPEAFDAALASARSEAKNAFGNDQVILERVVERPRHIEVQVLVDTHGKGIHLGERDCSVQRRYQKVLEEAPAPGLSAELRERMGRAAVDAAVRYGYEGVGTVEFLLDARGEFYFMEMNTRLQVEHPVTEAITGIDLVEWQLRVARGEPLTLRQSDIAFEGHAIEARLCAEDPMNDDMPQSGTVHLWGPPARVRVETFLEDGIIVSPHYDSMLAKLIAHGRTRDDARRKLLAALRETVVFGIETNQRALTAFLEDPRFVAGGVSTDFIRPGDVPAPDPALERLALAVAASALCGPGADATVLLADGEGREHTVRVSADRVHADRASADADGQTVSVDGEALALAVRRTGQGRVRYASGGVESSARFLVRGHEVFLHLRGRSFRYVDRTYMPAMADDEGGSASEVRAHSNGRVVACLVQEGELVEPGSPLLTVEAMKMEYTFTAVASARVLRILTEKGAVVSAGSLLVELEPC